MSSEWKNKIKSGKYTIDKNVNSTTSEKINEAQGYWNSYLKTLDSIENLQAEIETAENSDQIKIYESAITHHNPHSV